MSCAAALKYPSTFHRTRIQMYSFHLHANLRLNITIMELEVLSFTSLSLSTSNSVKICGKHSSGVNVYPSSFLVNFTEKFDVPVKSQKFQFIHTAIDQSVIESHSSLDQQNAIFFVTLLSTHYWVNSNEISQTYLLRAKHVEYFHISTFLLESERLIILEHLSLPLKERKNVQCFRLQMTQQKSANVTFSDFKYIGYPNRFLCDFAGVALYNVISQGVKVLEQHVIDHVCTCTGNTKLTLICNKQDQKFLYPQQHDSKSMYTSLIWCRLSGIHLRGTDSFQCCISCSHKLQNSNN